MQMIDFQYTMCIFVLYKFGCLHYATISLCPVSMLMVPPSYIHTPFSLLQTTSTSTFIWRIFVSSQLCQSMEGSTQVVSWLFSLYPPPVSCSQMPYSTVDSSCPSSFKENPSLQYTELQSSWGWLLAVSYGPGREAGRLALGNFPMDISCLETCPLFSGLGLPIWECFQVI